MTEPPRATPALFVVATPIGNLQDITARAVEVLRSVSVIAAEDTRHSSKLLQHIGATAKLLAYHDYSSSERTEELIQRIRGGESMALISDAGTPLISDPGFELVKLARNEGIAVIPVPGPSALTAALSISGLPCDRFCFEGFLPAKQPARLKHLEALAEELRTLVFYEAPHRIRAVLIDMEAVFGRGRKAFIGRELTKIYESATAGTLEQCRAWIDGDQNHQRGEFVVVVAGADKEAAGEQRLRHALSIIPMLLEHMSPSRAAAIAAQITGARKNSLYEAVVKADKRDP
ncbi:MAG: 16S rRNA (cytidine(1402)-2'-O)-methyltransferase [Pseudohongiellaceae bacterium]